MTTLYLQGIKTFLLVYSLSSEWLELGLDKVIKIRDAHNL